MVRKIVPQEPSGTGRKTLTSAEARFQKQRTISSFRCARFAFQDALHCCSNAKRCADTTVQTHRKQNGLRLQVECLAQIVGDLKEVDLLVGVPDPNALKVATVATPGPSKCPAACNRSTRSSTISAADAAKSAAWSVRRPACAPDSPPIPSKAVRPTHRADEGIQRVPIS